jgi:putative SOS response-associated peptidase YedK
VTFKNSRSRAQAHRHGILAERFAVAALRLKGYRILAFVGRERTANEFTRRMHDRMPVLLGHHDLDAWLTGKAGVELLRPAPNDLLRMWPGSKRVNVSNRGDDDASLIEPVEDEAITSG